MRATTTLWIAAFILAATAHAGDAYAQPQPAGPVSPWPEDAAKPPPPTPEPSPAAPRPPPVEDEGAPADDDASLAQALADAQARAEAQAQTEAAAQALTPTPLDGRPFERRRAAPAEKFSRMPMLFNTSTADLPGAGRIILGAGVDTGGAIGTDARIGLGEVAEFGVGTTDLMRVRTCPTCEAEGVRGYPVAMFKMGIAEHRLFRHQPSLALGFRKSFEREHDQRASRVAELYLVASKQVGKLTRLHAGGVFWDAEVSRLAMPDVSVTLHERGVAKQMRAFGGIEVAPLPRSRILVEVGWVPEFRLNNGGTDVITLRPMLTWGVRYELAAWAMFESGVRVPDIGDVNLIDAQIFGQLRLVSDRFARLIDNLQ